jgi:hypothetical protein
MFTRNSVLAFAAVSTVAVAALAPTGAFAMRGGFDGNWMVQITTSRGTCSSGVGFGVMVRDGVVSAAGGFDVRGNVAANGARPAVEGVVHSSVVQPCGATVREYQH